MKRPLAPEVTVPWLNTLLQAHKKWTPPGEAIGNLQPLFRPSIIDQAWGTTPLVRQFA
jgi:hypothetical protein